MTRLNVYAGPAGFYLLRGGPDDKVIGTLPGPAPALGDLPGVQYYEIPIAIQDRAFNSDGSLFYPTVGSSSMNLPGHTFRTAIFRRSGTRSFSAIRWW